MDSKLFFSEDIWDRFQHEYYAKQPYTGRGGWKLFISNKDLGIRYTPSYTLDLIHVYEVVDEQKWLLTKLKYGF
jgi:hypothetical protein